HVAQAVREIDGVDDTRLLSSPALSPKLVFCISAVLVVLLVWLLIRFSGGQTTVVASVDDAGAGIKAAPQQIVRADASVAACNELLRLWNSPMLPAQTDIDKIDLQLEFSLRGLNLLRIKGRFSDVSSMNRPLLLPIKREQGGGFMALVSRSEDGLWQVVPDYKGQSKLRSEELNALISGEVFAPWKDFASIGNLLPPGVSGENVRRLQSLLGLTGCSQDLSGVYDAATVACVENFQQHSDLIADGLVGPKTLMMIYRAAGSYPTPTLY
ncbi:MAG: peptidoglycan-binding protein, partial [Desulfuromonadales bacterium]|nr:peptidoglycan-binding protein [Desulfuromonadales bacterium]